MAKGELGRYSVGGSVTVPWGARVGVVGPCDFLTQRQCTCEFRRPENVIG